MFLKAAKNKVLDVTDPDEKEDWEQADWEQAE